ISTGRQRSTAVTRWPPIGPRFGLPIFSLPSQSCRAVIISGPAPGSPATDWPPPRLSAAEVGGGGPLGGPVRRSDRWGCGSGRRGVAFRAYSGGPGSEAVGEVELEVELPGRRVAVRASSTDVVEAAGHALVAALNQYNAKRRAQG